MTLFDDFKTGSFYVTDDDVTLIHQYYTEPASDLLDDSATIHVSGQVETVIIKQRQPTAVANTSTIEVGKTRLVIKNAFVTLLHTTLEDETPLFIKNLTVKIVDTYNCETFDDGAKPFQIRVRGANDERISHKGWELYTRPAGAGAQDATISSKMFNDLFSNNTEYKDTGVRTTLYLNDRDHNICYKLKLIKLNVVQNGVHSEPDI